MGKLEWPAQTGANQYRAPQRKLTTLCLMDVLLLSDVADAARSLSNNSIPLLKDTPVMTTPRLQL